MAAERGGRSSGEEADVENASGVVIRSPLDFFLRRFDDGGETRDLGVSFPVGRVSGVVSESVMGRPIEL